MVRAQAPGGTGPGVPAAALLLQAAELVQAARALVEQQRVVVAPALDVDALRDRVADVVALVAVLEGDARAARLARDDVERDPDRLPLPEARPEVGVQAGVRADRGDDRGGALRDGQAVDSPVPRVRAREDRTARSGGNAERMGGATGGKHGDGRES